MFERCPESWFQLVGLALSSEGVCGSLSVYCSNAGISWSSWGIIRDASQVILQGVDCNRNTGKCMLLPHECQFFAVEWNDIF